MAIHRSGTFEYEAEFTKEGFGDSDIALFGRDRGGGIVKRLIGPKPKIRFWNNRLVIIASEETNSTVRNASFLIGDAVKLVARPGDKFYVTRTGSGGIGMSVLREQELILATGAVTAVPLGHEVKTIRHPEEAWNFASETWLEFRIRNQSIVLRERETAEVEGYHVYVERPWQSGVPGTDECVSVSQTADPLIKVAAMRSAILLGNSGLKLVNWDCTEDSI